MTMAADKQDKVLNVPTLRFPEFSGDWKESTIGKEFELYSCNTPSRLDKENCVGDVNWITSGELKEHYIGDTKEKISESSAKENNLRLMPEGTFVIAIYGLEAEGVRSTGSIITKRSTISQACMAFTPKGDISNEFMYSWYKKHGNVIGIRYAQGTKQQNLSYDIIEKFKIRYPSLKEQDKLNSFISLLDTRIATQIRIIDKLQSLMKGLAEHLTEFTPNIKIADCLNCHSSVLQENQVKSEGKYKVYGANGICGYSDKPAILEDAILIVKDGSGVGNVSYASGEYSVIGTSNYLTAKSGYSLKYLYYSLMVFNFIPYKTGLAIPHIYFKDYRKALIYCPSLDKQVQIASLLSKIECKIEADKAIADFYQQQKRFLLQSMFI